MSFRIIFNNPFSLLVLAISLSSHSLHAYVMFSKNTREAILLAKPYLPQKPVILEAGAYDGTESVYFTQIFPQATVHTFEPIPALYQTLVTRTKSYKNIFTYQLALSDSIGTAAFYVSKEGLPNKPSGSSSLLPPTTEFASFYPHISFYTQINVPTTTIDAWAQKNKVDHIDLMWLDMQGYELRTLKASPHILKTVTAIIMEVEIAGIYKDQCLYNDVKAFLEEQGFEFVAANFAPEGPSEQASGDLLFLRKKH